MKTSQGHLRVVVEFASEVTADDAERILKRYTQTARAYDPSGRWAAELKPDQLKKLAGENSVIRIEEGPQPFRPLQP